MSPLDKLGLVTEGNGTTGSKERERRATGTLPRRSSKLQQWQIWGRFVEEELGQAQGQGKTQRCVKEAKESGGDLYIRGIEFMS